MFWKAAGALASKATLSEKPMPAKHDDRPLKFWGQDFRMSSIVSSFLTNESCLGVKSDVTRAMMSAGDGLDVLLVSSAHRNTPCFSYCRCRGRIGTGPWTPYCEWKKELVDFKTSRLTTMRRTLLNLWKNSWAYPRNTPYPTGNIKQRRRVV